MVARNGPDPAATECDGRCSQAAGGRSTAQWVIAVALAVIATCLVVRLVDGPSWLPEARAQTARMGAAGVFAFAGQLGARSHGLFMVDVDAGNVWCYEYVPEKGKLKLVAGRSFLYDRYLEEFNTDSPTPSDVAQLVNRMRAHKTREAGAGKPVSSNPGN
jgi:hypothetical protein